MVDRYETIIGYRYEGQEQVRQYLADLERVNQRSQAIENVSQVRREPFGSPTPFDSSTQEALNRTTLRDYDALTRAVVKLRDAELARAQAHSRLNRTPDQPGWVGAKMGDQILPGATAIMQERLDLQSRARVDAATEVLERERDKARARNEAELAAAQRRLAFGPIADTMFRNDGSLDYGDKSLQKAAQTGVTQARRERAEQERKDARFAAGQEKALQDAVARGVAAARKEAAAREKAAEDLVRQRERALQGAVGAAARISAATRLQAAREEAEQAANDRKRQDVLFDRRARALAEEAAAIEAGARARRTTGQQLMAGRAAYRETLGQNAIFDAFQPTYASPDQRTKLGQAQAGVNRAERALEIATLARAGVLKDSTTSALQRQRAEQSYESALNALTTAQRRVSAQLAAGQVSTRVGGFGGARQDFMTGFRGASDRPYAEQIGQAFKFSVFYGTAYKLLFALTTTLTATLQEGIEFQKAMTELKIASGASADAAADMAEGLAAQATLAGAAPSQGVIIGARSLGLFGATESSGASLAEQERIAEISARVVNRMALGSKTDPLELQTQIAAVANAFGGGAQGQIRAYDLDAYLGRRFGVMPGETIQSVAESGTVGQAAGFNQEEVFAIAAALQSRTGQTSSAVAGWMAQIFSRGGEGSLVSLAGKYGIDQSADLATQIEELARVYQNATNTERAEIAAGFGRGKVQNAAVVMLDEFDTIMREAQSARTGATGEGDKIFELRMNDIGGQIQQTLAVMKAFASELGRSGLLDIVGGVIVAFRELVEAATSVLQLWNQMPGALKATIAGLALLALAARNGAAVGALGGVSLVQRAGMVGTPVGNAIGIAGPATQAAASRGLATGVAAMGRAALSFIGPVGLAVGGLLAVGALKQSSDRMREAQESAEEALRSSGLGTDATSSDYIASASELDMLAQQNRDATGGFMNFITAGQADNDNIEIARQLEEEARRRRAVADAIDARAAANPIESPAIADFQADTIKEALDLVTASGGDADDRLRLLTQALDGTGDAAIRAAAKIDVDFAGRMATAFRDAINGATEAIPLSEKISTATQIGTAEDRRAVRYQLTEDRYDTTDNLSTLIPGESATLGEVFDATQTELQDRLAKQLEERNIASLADIDKKTARELAEGIVETGDFDERLDGSELDDARGRIVDMIARQLRGEAMQWRKLLTKNTDLTQEEVAAIGESIDTEFDAKLDAMPETDLGGRARVQRRRLGRLLQTRAQAGDDEDISGLMVRIGNARSQVAQAEIARLEQVRRAQQQNARSAAAIRRAGMRSLRGQIAAAIRGGNQDDLAEVLSRAGAGGVQIARQMIENVREIAATAIRIQAALFAVNAAAGNLAGGIAGIMGQAGNIGKILELDTLAASLANTTVGDGTTFTQGSDVEGTDKYFPDPESGAGKSPEDRKAEREAARQEMLDLRNNLYLLSIDLSDPLAMATAAVKDARRRLQSDIASGQSRGTVAASRVALRQAQIEREATAFQQRLEAMQTAEELGRISHRKYISYLENERKRLGAIKNRTYQQQQQLDEIDRLMKDAAEQMQGQWNFGDIKLPTPYQVRRQVEQMRLDRVSQLDAASNRAASTVTTINIDGADTGKVRQIIQQTLGSANSTVTTRPRRR